MRRRWGRTLLVMFLVAVPVFGMTVVTTLVRTAHDTIHATLILESDLSVTSEEELLSQIEEEIVNSYLPSFERNDFIVTVFRGEEISSYTDSGHIDDGEEE